MLLTGLVLGMGLPGALTAQAGVVEGRVRDDEGSAVYGAQLRLVQAGVRPTDALTLAATSESSTSQRSGQLITLSDTEQPRHYLATVTGDAGAAPSSGGMVFDRSGRLSGVVTSDGADDTTVRVLSAADAVAAAEEMLGRQPG